MTSLRRAFLAGTTTAAILLGPAVPSGSTRHAKLPAGLPVQAAAFSWPLDPPTAILRGFTPPPEPWLPGHRGIDLTARPGQPVRAAGAGTVTFAGPIAGRGVVVVLLAGPVAGHRQLRVTYEPVRSRVHRGDSVRTGDLVGWLEDATRHCGPLGTCLHWGLRRGETYLDPLLLVRPRRIRLLPLDRALASIPARWPPLWTFAQAPGSSQPGPGPADQATAPAAPDPAVGPVASDHAKTLTAPKQSLTPDAYKPPVLWPMAVVTAVSRAAAALARAELAALAGQAVARIRGSPSASRS
jgi:hypothetical protein